MKPPLRLCAIERRLWAGSSSSSEQEADVAPKDSQRQLRRAPCKGGAFQWVKAPPGETLQPEATGAVMEVTKWLKPSDKRTANRAAQALRLAAAVLRSSQSSLGAYFRRLCARLDRPKAITATAHKLARLIYTMLTKGSEYADQGQDYFEERYRQRVMLHLAKRAERPGFHLTPIPEVD